MAQPLGQLGVEVYASTSRLEGDMARAAQIVESRARTMDQAAVRARKSLEGIGEAAGRVGRINGVREAANDMDHLAHASAGARREMLVIAHEVFTGNFKRAAGSVMVLGERMDWLGKIMSPTGALLGVLAAGAIAVAVAFVKGAEQSTAFAHALQVTGNYAGLTEGQFNDMAHAIAASSGTTIGNAREISQAFVAGGRLSGAALESASIAAAKLSALTGQKSEEIVHSMEKMSDGVDKWALEANKQYHFVDGALYEHIRTLEQQGRTEQAELALLEALNAHLGDLDKNLGYLQSAWKGVKDMASGAWDAMLSWGRKKTVDDQLADAEKEVNRIKGAMQGAAGGVNADIYARQLSDALGRVSELTRAKMREQDNALLEQQRADERTRSADNQAFYDKLIQETRTREQERADAIKDINRRADESHWSPEMRAKAIAAANEKYKDKGAAAGARADLGAAMKPLEDQIAAEDKLLAQREQVLARYYRDNKISVEGYYGDQETIIDAHTKRIATLYDQEIATLEKYASKAKDHATKVEALTRAHELADKKEQAIAADREKLALATEGLARDTETYREAVEKLNAELAKQQGRPSSTAAAEFDRTNRALLDRARAAGDTSTLGLAAQVRSGIEAQDRMNELKQEALRIETELALQETRINLLTKTGQQSELQGMIDIGEKRTEAAQKLDDIAAKMQDIAQQTGLAPMILEADQFKTKVIELQDSANQLGRTFDEIFASSFSGFINTAVSGTKTLKQNFLDMANSIEQAITRIVAQDLAQRLFGIGGGAGGGGLFGALFQLLGLTGGGGGGGGGGSYNFTMPSTSGGGDTSGLSSLFGIFSLLGRASGGPVGAGSLYEVNERGPELLTVASRTYLMMGDDSGRVTPMSDSAGMGNQNVFHLNIAVPPGTTRQSSQQQAAEIMRHANIAMARYG
ncbi:prophage tail length tape measure [Burkholderia pseudomallei]|nr:prophage tail length tape measure [Burkholderia pseudomallei]